jgi:cell division septation protein DedD
MKGVFYDEEFEQPRTSGDTEVTLGMGAVVLIVLGLIILCGLCFGLGYVVGHRGAQPAASAEQLPAGTQKTAQGNGTQANGSQLKPSAIAQTAAPPPAQNDPPQVAAGQPQSPGAAMTPNTGQPASNPATQQPATSSQPVVRPAFPSAANAAQTVSASSAQPAAPPAVPLMVQIAAVSHDEDASVLVGALRKHGYEVSARREPADNLIHVRIGPFNDRNEANRWRLKLLNDGYNALIQP